MRDDTDEIVRRLEQDREAILSKYWPGWTRVGSKALLTPSIKKGQKKPTSSFLFYFAHGARTKANTWYRFSEGVGGGIVALLHYGETGRVPSGKSDWADAFRFARQFLGMENAPELTEEEKRQRDERRERDRQDREERDHQQEKTAAKAKARRQLDAMGAWNETVPIGGTQGEAYFGTRGFPPIAEWPWDCSATIRFHPSLDFEMDRDVPLHPAVVALVVDAFGAPTAIWQIYLTPGKPEKAGYLMPSCKIGRGPAAGGAVRVGGDAGRIGTSEGLETSLGFWFLEDCRKPIWSLCSTSGMIGFEPPIFVKHNSIYPDGDKGQLENNRLIDPPGIRAARACHSRMLEIGIGSNINEGAFLGDGNDLFLIRKRNEKAG